MYGGNITNNFTFGVTNNIADKANNGGGVCVSKDSAFNMYGGEISGNKSNLTGGGVYNLGTMTVSGDAKISGNGKNSRNYSNAYMGE